MKQFLSRLRCGVLCALYMSGLAPMPAAAAPQSGGAHDFDFSFGTFKAHIERLAHPLTGSKKWIQLEGTHTTKSIWNGRANFGVMDVSAVGGNHFQGVTLNLYNPVAHQWNISFASSADGVLEHPAIGSFKNGRGEFFDQESYNNRNVLARTVISDITTRSYKVEQAYSEDGGATWETFFIMTLSRTSNVLPSRAASIVSHDFDFHMGTWKTHISRLLHPLSGSTARSEYDGVSVVRPIWGGGASVFELEASGPAGHIEGVGLRLYNPRAHQWSLNWANSAAGSLGEPTVGEFRNGSGVFVDQETYNGRTILVRNTFTDITTRSSRFEQAFSSNYGHTWETNWVMTFHRP